MRPLLLLFLIASTLYAEPVWIGSYSNSSGEKLIWEAQPEQFQDTTSWSGSGQCPFDIPKLIAAATDYAQSKLNHEGVSIDSIFIQRADRTSEIAMLKNKWYLTIGFNRSNEAFPGSVRILPDGVIIEPRKKEK